MLSIITKAIEKKAPDRANTFFQPKRAVNQPNGVCKQEADTVAAAVMKTEMNTTLHQPFFSPAISSVQRTCRHCEEKSRMQRKEDNSRLVSSASKAEQYISQLSGGKPLGTDEKKFFESRIGYDFSNVHLHTDSKANESAKELNALAYTAGNNIVFGANQYQPYTDSGKKLLAHELTHVVQQRAFSVSGKIQKLEELSMRANPYGDDALDKNPYHVEELLAEEDKLVERLTEPLQRRDGMGFMVRLRTLSEEDTRRILFSKRLRQTFETRFSGGGLWSIFSVLFSNLNIRSTPLTLLGLALHDGDAQRTADMLSILELNGAARIAFDEVMRIVLPQIFTGNPLLQQMNDILDNKVQRGSAMTTVLEAHYEKTQTGESKMNYSGHTNSFSFRATPQEMRIVGKLRFVKPGKRQEPFYFLGTCAPILQSWLDSIQTLWNNRFILSNGITTLKLVFLPVVVYDSSVSAIEVHTDASEICTGGGDPGRANASCWFTKDDASVAAHEFGHHIGASDEYNLPATAAEIPADIASNLSAEDIALTTLQGIGGGFHPAGNGNRGGNINKSLMSDDTANVYLRHIRRLVNAINSRLPAGTPPYKAADAV